PARSRREPRLTRCPPRGRRGIVRVSARAEPPDVRGPVPPPVHAHPPAAARPAHHPMGPVPGCLVRVHPRHVLPRPGPHSLVPGVPRRPAAAVSPVRRPARRGGRPFLAPGRVVRGRNGTGTPRRKRY